MGCWVLGGPDLKACRYGVPGVRGPDLKACRYGVLGVVDHSRSTMYETCLITIHDPSMRLDLESNLGHSD